MNSFTNNLLASQNNPQNVGLQEMHSNLTNKDEMINEKSNNQILMKDSLYHKTASSTPNVGPVKLPSLNNY